MLICLLFLIKDPQVEPQVENFPRGYTVEEEQWEEPVVVEKLLSIEECNKIIEISKDKFSQSQVIGANTGDRTSETAWISKDDPIAQKILLKACEMTGKPIENCEELQIVRYKPGTFYRPHHDSCCENSEGCKDFEKLGGQRVGTLILYLNDDFTDGHTEFPNLKRKFKSGPGSGLFFRPMDKDCKKCHTLALHGGMPPSSGTKYLCNAWVRESKFIMPTRNFQVV